MPTKYWSSDNSKTKTAKPAKDGRLLKRIAQVDQLPKRDGDTLVRTIDAFIGKASLKVQGELPVIYFTPS